MSRTRETSSRPLHRQQTQMSSGAGSRSNARREKEGLWTTIILRSGDLVPKVKDIENRHLRLLCRSSTRSKKQPRTLDRYSSLLSASDSERVNLDRSMQCVVLATAESFHTKAGYRARRPSGFRGRQWPCCRLRPCR